MIKYILSIGILILTLASLKGQNISDFDNIILEDSFLGKNLHEVLMDVNASKSIFIAYDVNSATHIKIKKNYKNQSLSTLLKELVNTDIKKVDSAKYLIRFEQKIIPKQEEKHYISGRILDLDKQTIPFALVSIDQQNAVYADENGEFKIPTKKSKNQLLCVNMLGYKTKCQTVTNYNNEVFILSNNPIELETILLKRSSVKAKIKEGNFEIQMNQFLKQNAIGGDIIRTLNILPSVHSKNDLSAEVQFRNTYVEENLIQYEKIPLFMTTHMYGFFSSINNLAVDKISIFPNNVPVEYVSRTGGMILLENDFSNKNLWNSSLFIDFLTAQGAISYNDKKNNFKITGRSSLGSISNKKFYSIATQEDRLLDQKQPIHLLNPAFKFNDFTFFFQHHFNSIWSLDLSGINIQDENYYELRSRIRIPIKNNKPVVKDSTTIGRIIEEKNKINQNGIAIFLNAKWNKHWVSSLEFTASNYAEKDTIETKTIQKTKHKDRILIERFDYQNTLSFYRLQYAQKYNPSSKSTFNFGVNMERYNTSIINSISIKAPFRPAKTKTTQFPSKDIDFSGFASWKYIIAHQFTLLTSAKTTYNTKLMQQLFSSRIQFIYSPNQHWNLSVNSQSSYQTLRKIYSENPFGKPQNFWSTANNKKIAPISSKSFSLNINYQNEDWVFTNSLYVRQSEGITEWVNTTPGYRKDSTNRVLGPQLNFFTGVGKGMGFESLLSKRTGNLQTWLSYRLSKSLERFPSLYGGNWIPSSDDQRHNFHFVANYKHHDWNTEIAYQYGSGRRYLNISNFSTTRKRQSLQPKDFDRLPDYHRVDYSISYEWNLLSQSHLRLTASISNLFDTPNSYYRQYPLLVPQKDGSKESVITGTDFNQLGRFWNLRMEVEF